MSRDYEVAGGDGLLTRDELRVHIDKLERERSDAIRSREPIDTIEMRLLDSQRLLRDMDMAGADALSYLPERLQGLSDRLKRRATELLMLDDEYGIGDIDRIVIQRARERYLDMDARSLAALNSRNSAINEIDELARAVGLY